jgi:hypothetical protein
LCAECRAHKQRRRQARLFKKVLPILLQQPGLGSDIGLICKLLATSRKVAAAVMDLCNQQVSIAFPHRLKDPTCQERNWEQQREIKLWLESYGSLVREMFVELLIFDFDSIFNFELLILLLQQYGPTIRQLKIIFWLHGEIPTMVYVSDDVGYAALELAFVLAAGGRHQAAVALFPLSKLETFCSNAWPSIIVDQLPVDTLQHLSLNMEDSSFHWRYGMHSNEDPYLAALRRLTNLKQLELVVQQVPPGLVQALTGMTGLTCLQLTPRRGQCWHDTLQQLRGLPQQLQELTFALESDHSRVDIGCLTALTRLNLVNTKLKETDVLSPNIRILTTGFTDRWDAVLSLQQLQELTVKDSKHYSEAWLLELEQLSGVLHLTALTVHGRRFRRSAQSVHVLLAGLLPQVQRLHCQSKVDIDERYMDSSSDGGTDISDDDESSSGSSSDSLDDNVSSDATDDSDN